MLHYLRIAVTALSLMACVLLIALWVRDRGVQIPLSSILTTSGQEGLQYTTSAYREADGKKEYVFATGEALQHFLEETKGNGATNVFLVDAPDEASAIRLSSTVVTGYESANFPVTLNEPNPPRGNNWLVVYLGIGGSNPTRWFVDNVTVDEAKITFNYHKKPAGFSTCDIHYYYYWVPLGKLDKGVYHFELYESNLKAVTLSRRVEILPPRQTKRG